MLQPVTNNHQPSPDRNYGQEEYNAMMRAVINLFEKWGLTDAQAARLLGGMSGRTYQRWRNGASSHVNVDQSDRMSHLLGIHKALRILFPDRDRYYAWIRKQNAAFDDSTALDVMLGGHLSDIARIRNYLDSVRGGW